MNDVYINFTKNCKLHLQFEDGICSIARMVIEQMPLQPRILYPNKESVKNLLSDYGFTVCEWANSLTKEQRSEIAPMGIRSEDWFNDNIGRYLQ